MKSWSQSSAMGDGPPRTQLNLRHESFYKPLESIFFHGEDSTGAYERKITFFPHFLVHKVFLPQVPGLLLSFHLHKISVSISIATALPLKRIISYS